MNPEDFNITHVRRFLRHNGKKELSIRNFNIITSILRTYFGAQKTSLWFVHITQEWQMAGQFRNKEFASLSLTAADEKKFDDWRQAIKDSATELLTDLMEQGYKVSVSWVVDSSSFCLSIIGTDDCMVNKNSIMTSWSDDLDEAVQIAVYKHVVICDNGEWPLRSNGNRWG